QPDPPLSPDPDCSLRDNHLPPVCRKAQGADPVADTLSDALLPEHLSRSGLQSAECCPSLKCYDLLAIRGEGSTTPSFRSPDRFASRYLKQHQFAQSGLL